MRDVSVGSGSAWRSLAHVRQNIAGNRLKADGEVENDCAEIDEEHVRPINLYGLSSES
jgi:hypothetical protein